MGGVTDYGATLGTKTSPRRATIERVQAELRLEYDVREERKRELEFLEKGGNPLDYKFSLAASISLQSTSLTDQQLAEQHITSEVKGCFVLAASPHGDSIESSGRPGVPVNREANIANNILPSDHENILLDGQKRAKLTGKRDSVAHLEQTSDFDNSQNVKELEDSLSFRHGAQGQAYARRNRSRTIRNSASLPSTDIHHENRVSTLSSTRHSPNGTKECISEGQVEVGAGSSNSNSKAASPNLNAKSKDSNDRVNMILDPLQNNVATTETKVRVSDWPIQVDFTNNLQQFDPNIISIVPENISDGIGLQSGQDIVKEPVSVDVMSIPLEFSTKKIDLVGEEVNGINALEISMIDKVYENPSEKTCRTSTMHSTMDSIIPSKEEKSCEEMSTLLVKANGNTDWESEQKLADERTSSLLDEYDVKEKDQSIIINKKITLDEPSSCIHVKEEVSDSKIIMEYDGAPTANTINTKLNSEITDEPQTKDENSVGVSNSSKEAVGMKNAGALPICETSVVEKKKSNSATELLNPSEELTKKAQEDAILKEACMIEAKLKRAGDLSSCNKLSEKRLKCHWDFVLEEMAWMANDFMQENLWKITAAAQVSRLISSSGLSNFEHMNLRNKQKNIARTMAKAIMGFWHAAEVFSCNHSTLEEDDWRCYSDNLVSWNLKQSELQKLEVKDHSMSDSDHSGNALTLRIQNYAVRFLKFSSCPSKYSSLAEAPNTPDRQNDPGILDMSWEEQDPQEKLFYTVPPGAMLAYRDYIESQCVQDKNMGHMVHQEDCETSLCDSVADGNRDNAYEEDDCDTDAYCFPVASDISSKFGHKKKKHLVQKSYAPRLYETSANLSYEPCVEIKSGNTPFTINGKRPSSLNVGSIPTKRVRSAARQRVMSPFTPGVNTSIQVSSKTDVSSGETSSLQDDQSSLYGGSQPRKSLEVESTMDFDRQLTYDGNEVSTKVKKEKKPKHFGYKNSINLTETGLLTVPGKGPSFESRFLDSMSQHDQKDHMKKRTETHHLDSNGISVSYAQHPAKKPKLLKQLQEISPEAPNPVTGSMPSPAASQMSNMSNSNKLLKIISRERGRKPKGLKLAVGQSGSGSPWLNYEDQALIVLVHDLGANWELVSDAINSILLFKHRFFRTPNECKERHKVLLDKNAGDGADSAEDSGSSQPYPSTLPRIPKGSARQLLQRLQGPMEEDILKRHFEKIISLVRQLHSCRHRNANQESKQIIPAHSSHVIAISQACPGHIKGGILTPLDLCDANTSSPDAFPLVYQGAHSSGLVMPSHHGSMAPVLPASGVNTMLPGSPGLVLSSSLSSPSVSLNPSPRDAQRFSASRSSSLSVDDTQRVHQYSQMLSGRGLQQSSMPMNGPLQTGGNGVQVFPSSNGVGMSGVNRSMPGQRSGFPGMSSNMLNMASTGNLLSSGGQGVQTPVNVHPGVSSGPGNLMLRPRGPLHMLRAGESTEENRQVMREQQAHTSQGNGQAISTFNGANAAFPSMPVPPSIQTFSVQQHQQSHTLPQQPHILGKPQHPHMKSSVQTNSQQQAYAIQRQLQLRNQPQAPFPGSIVVPPVQGNSLIQVPVLPSPVTPVASSPGQSKQQNVARNLHSTTQNPIVKQKQRQQIEPQQQRQQPHQQGKLIKGIGRPNISMNQNMTGDTSQDTGFSTAPKTQASERPILQQGQSLFHNNSGLSQNLSHAVAQAKMYRQTSQSSKQITSAGDSSNQGSSSSNMPSHQQAHIPTSVPLPSQNHHQQHQRHIMNQAPQNIRMLQQNRQNSADGRAQCSTDQVQGNQMVASTSTTYCTDSSTSSAIASVNRLKPDPPSEANPPTAKLAKSMPEDSAANDISAASSRGSVARQFSGNVSTPGHNVEGQWIPQPQQLLPPKSQH